MSGDFLDSNVVLYSLDASDPHKRSIAAALIADGLNGDSPVISFQVVQEVLNVAGSRLQPPMPRVDALRLLEGTLEPLWTVDPSPQLYARALGIRERYRFSFYDSLIVAAALEAGCERLLSEDLQHGQEIEGLRIENPFLEAAT